MRKNTLGEVKTMTFIISDEQKKGIPEPTQEDLDKITEIISSNPNVKVQKKFQKFKVLIKNKF